MQKVIMNLLPKQAEDLANQLLGKMTLVAKVRLAKKLDIETRQTRWQALTASLRQKFAQNPLTPKEIRRLCEAVRQERHSAHSR